MLSSTARRRATSPVEWLSRFGLLIFGLLTLGCDTGTDCEDCNVVLVLVDTLRADHLASYGYSRQTSPFLDDFAASNIQFVNTRSQAACTYPSVNSLLTSRHTFEFMDSSTRPGIPDDIPSLPEILGDRGWKTAAVSASPIVRRNPTEHHLGGGFGRGFEHFDEDCLWNRGRCVNNRAKRFLDQMEEPFFLYLHYMEPHDPYRPDEAARGRFADEYLGPHEFVARGDPNPIHSLIQEPGRGQVTSDDIAHLIDRYDEEILTVDAYLEALYGELEERGLLERTIVVFASDHGEAFLEHDVIKHCRGLYEPLTRVPLLMHIPGLDEPITRREWVENLDLVPTLLDYVGVEAGPFAGKSLRRMIESDDGESPHRITRASMGTLRSVNDERFKLIWKLDSRDYRLFDLVSDPEESRNLVDDETAAFRNLLRELRLWIEETEAGVSEDERVQQADAIEAELKALGYLP